MRTSPVLDGKLNLSVHLKKTQTSFIFFIPENQREYFFMQDPGTSLLPETGKQIVPEI
jgi:hypothetical protein